MKYLYTTDGRATYSVIPYSWPP